MCVFFVIILNSRIMQLLWIFTVVSCAIQKNNVYFCQVIWTNWNQVLRICPVFSIQNLYRFFFRVFCRSKVETGRKYADLNTQKLLQLVPNLAWSGTATSWRQQLLFSAAECSLTICLPQIPSNCYGWSYVLLQNIKHQGQSKEARSMKHWLSS